MGVIVSKNCKGPHALVHGTLKGLEGMGVYTRKRAEHVKRIGVTGSVGKTGTKDMLKLVLSEQGKTIANAASFNNYWGVSLTLSRMQKNADYGVFELGMDHAGEIRPLSRMVAPHVAIITTVTESHAEFFDSLEAIVDAKSEIFEGVVPGGAVVINRDHHHYSQMFLCAKSHKIENIYSFGEHVDADCKLVSVDQTEAESHVTLSLFGKLVSYTLPIPGMHWVMNSLAVLLAVHLVGAHVEKAAQALTKMTPPKGRGTRQDVMLSKGKILLIDESYNANPASMHAAISVLGVTQPYGSGRRIAVLGDMLELGEIADKRHVGLLQPLMKAKVDQVYCCGPHMKKLAESLPEKKLALHTKVSKDLIEPLLEDLREGDVLMIKGSHGSKMTPVVDAILNRQVGTWHIFFVIWVFSVVQRFFDNILISLFSK